MRHGFVDEPLPDIAALLVIELVVGIYRGHEPLFGNVERDAAGIYRDPATPPLLCDVRSSAAATGGVEDKVAGVGGHEEAAFGNFSGCLHHIYFIRRKATNYSITPDLVIG